MVIRRSRKRLVIAGVCAAVCCEVTRELSIFYERCGRCPKDGQDGLVLHRTRLRVGRVRLYQSAPGVLD